MVRGSHRAVRENSLAGGTELPRRREIVSLLRSASRSIHRGTWAASVAAARGAVITGGDTLLPVLSEVAGAPVTGGGPFALVGFVDYAN
jgi:hypothetical protein